MPRVSKYTEMAEAIVGGEPKFTADVVSEIQMINALNWYSQNRDYKDSAKYANEYLKKNKIKYDDSSIGSLSTTFGFLCRMKTRGAILSAKQEEHFTRFMSKLKPPVKKQDVTSNVISIQDRIAEKTNEIAGELEYSVDEFILNGFKKAPSPLAIMQDKVKSVHANRIVDIFKKERNEIESAISSDDEQVKEAYSKYKKSDMKKLVSYYDQIIADAITLGGQAAKTKKPRKRKVKTPEQLVAKIKYLKEEKTLNIKSVDPEKIIGAMQVWVYNAKTRFLGVYNADDAGGLSVKGSTILNYSESKSVSKKLRKPEVTIPEFMKGGKVYLRNCLANIKAKEKLLTGRMNNDTIILKIV